MQNFNFTMPVTLVFGKDCIKKNQQVFSTLGKKACIITGPFLNGRVTGTKHPSVTDVENALKSQGVEYMIYDECVPNPPVSTCVKAAKIVEDYDPDFLVAVGGGSNIDTTKAVELLLRYPGHDPYDVLFGDVAPERATTEILGTWCMGNSDDNKKIPFITVATTAGTGSEITGAAVLDREDIDNKAGTKPFVWSDYSFVDPNYIKTCDAKLMQANALDALRHGLEPYIDTGSKDHDMVQAFAELGLKLFAEIKDHLRTGEMTDDDYEKQMLMSTIMGFAETEGQTGVPHGLGYPLTHVKGLPHGLACGAFEGEYLKIFKDTTNIDKALSLLGFANVDEFAEYVHEVLDPHMEGMIVTRQEIEGWTDTFYGTEWRVARHPEEFDREDVKAVYERTLAKFIVD